MGVGPLRAVPKALANAGLSLEQIDLVEINEAFASQVLACARELGLEEERLNVNGGAIALGHPLGCSGARLAGAVAHQLAAAGSGVGVAALCIGVGQGMAITMER
jgi:acetyl-CoA acetyltransferase